MSVVAADLGLYCDDYFVGFITGNYDIEKDWDEYVKTCESMKASELTEIYQGEAFPTEVDREGTGVVYFVMEDGAYDTSSPMSQGEYNEWLSTNVGQSKEREMEYMNLTEENIALLRE